MRPFDKLSDEKFQLPITWFLINMILFYFTGKYPYSEIYNNHGANVLMKGGSRNKWFLSKWMWCIAGVILYYFVAYAFVAIFCLAVQVPISFDIRSIEYQNLLSPVFESTQIDTVKVMFLTNNFIHGGCICPACGFISYFSRYGIYVYGSFIYFISILFHPIFNRQFIYAGTEQYLLYRWN